MKTARGIVVVLGTLLALSLAACGGGGEKKTTAGAKKLDAAAADNAKGKVTWCIGKDTSGAFKKGVKAFNKANPDLRAKLVELPESADEQRAQLVQRLRAKSPECDLLGMDVIWTAEFAAQGWLQDASDAIEKRKGDWIPSTLDTAKFEGKYWAFPFNTNAGFVYYRKDQVGAPKSWEDVYKEAKAKDGLVYQGARYEGLTVNFLELLYSAGGKVLSDDGKKSEVNSDQSKKVLAFMADGVKRGAVAKAVTTYKEEEARRAFEAGRATYMRNWPYAYSLGKMSGVKDKFDITTFPSYGGAKGAGVLGGYDVAVSAYSKNPGGALAFANFLTSTDFEKTMMREASLPATLTATYDDPGVKKAFPFAPRLRTAVEQAKPRPVTPVYPQVSEAIYKNVHDALTGQASPDAAVSKMSSEIDKALATF